MHTDSVTLALGFLEGFALIISPCILPILPIMLAGSLTGSKKRPVGVILGFVFIFSVFTFFSRKLVQYSGIDINLIRHISYGLLIVLGIIMISGYLTEKFAQFTQRLANTGSGLTILNDQEGGMMSGILLGGLMAIIWTPCAGPILAAVIVQTVIQQTNVMSFLTLIAFAIGAAMPMLIMVLFGRGIMSKVGFLKRHTLAGRKIVGLIIIISVGYMAYSESASASPLSHDKKISPSINKTVHLQNGLSVSYLAPNISGIESWINSPPLSLGSLKNKVVLIDFWTYSCINCIRTVPFMNNMYHAYHDKGLVIIGVHSPEFDFEKNKDNVSKAVIHDGIKYPVALDNQFVTWQNFNNNYWPAQYLIDKNGYVVYTHFGEGDDAVMENNIRYLLNINEPVQLHTVMEKIAVDSETPETYLGYARAENFSNAGSVLRNQSAAYAFPAKLSQNEWALQGQWIIKRDKIISNQDNADLKINFHARKVFIVMGNPSGKAIDVNIRLNNNIQTARTLKVNHFGLYDALSFDSPANGVLQVTAASPGLEIYTFTFG